MISNELESLRTGYETLGMTPEELSEDRGLDLTSVKAALLQCSSKYRTDIKAARPESDLDFNDDDMAMANNVIRETAQYSENPLLRFNAAVYIRDDKKGRKNMRAALGGNTFNILQFNESIARMRETANRVKGAIVDCPA